MSIPQFSSSQTPAPPRWLHRLATFDGVDTLLLFFGLPAAYATGRVPGLFAGGLIFLTQMVLRKTPVLPRSVRALAWTIQVARGDHHLLHQAARQVFQFLEDEHGASPQPVFPAAERRVIPTRVSTSPRYRSVYKGLERLPALLGYQIVIYGPTKSGKSSVIKALLVARQNADLVILDPHYEPGNWPGRAAVVGPGLNWPAIDRALDFTLAEMQSRYQKLAAAPRGTARFRPLVLVVDEMSALTMEIPDAGKRLLNLAQQGRKVNLWTMLTPHSTEVAQMGAQGRGNARENFAFIEMPFVREENKYKPRIVTVYFGNPRRKDNPPVGRYIVPPPKVYTGTPSLNPARICGPARPGPEPVPPGGPGKGRPTAPGSRHSPGTTRHSVSEAAFYDRFGKNPGHARQLAVYLLQRGYGTRKISIFLPFANTKARQLVNGLRARYPHLAGERPAPGSPAEQELVLRLHALGAPLRRIAALLDGNDGENLARIERYG